MKSILEFIGLIAVMFIVMIITTLMSDSIYKYLYQTECIVFKHIYLPNGKFECRKIEDSE